MPEVRVVAFEHGEPEVISHTLRGPTIPLDVGSVKVGVIGGVDPSNGIMSAGVLPLQSYRITPDIGATAPLCTRLEHSAGPGVDSGGM